MQKFNESVQEMKEKYSIQGAIKKLDMNYSELYHIIIQCTKSRRIVSDLNKKMALGL